ncbi:hypothetical protein F4774DRAFT_413446 [Daldinia eschscholtzii]|nr:hypothetical protein F4774DRAFT_413446 [Daldinia eschscholtzii]
MFKPSSWPAPKWGETENTQLLTTLPGFSFHVDTMPPVTKIIAFKEIILLAGGMAAMPGVLNGIKLIFDSSYAIFKEYGKEYIKQNDFIWLRIWEENESWTSGARLATPNTIKLVIDFYVDAFKRGQRRDGGNGITLPINAAHILPSKRKREREREREWEWEWDETSRTMIRRRGNDRYDSQMKGEKLTKQNLVSISSR